MPRATDDERLDITLPQGAEGEELQIGERTIRILRQPIRTSTITDMVYVDGTPLIAGLSNEEFASKLRRIPFLFSDEVTGSNLEIFHVSHGKWETAAPIRAFVPYDGGRSILASYTWVLRSWHFPLVDLDSGRQGCRPHGRRAGRHESATRDDMVSFAQDGEEHLLVANSPHGLVKIACRDIDGQVPLTEPREPVGVPRETKDLGGITRLANLGASHVLALQSGDGGRQHLRSPKHRLLVAYRVIERIPSGPPAVHQRVSWSRCGGAGLRPARGPDLRRQRAGASPYRRSRRSAPADGGAADPRRRRYVLRTALPVRRWHDLHRRRRRRGRGGPGRSAA